MRDSMRPPRRAMLRFWASSFGIWEMISLGGLWVAKMSLSAELSWMTCVTTLAKEQPNRISRIFTRLPPADRRAANYTLHWTGATTVLVIRSLVVGPGQ